MDWILPVAIPPMPCNNKPWQTGLKKFFANSGIKNISVKRLLPCKSLGPKSSKPYSPLGVEKVSLGWGV